jgi:rhamnulokinase
VLVQARATRELGSLAELREVAAASAAPEVYEPSDDRDAAEAIYHRFLTATGAAVPARA